MIDTPADGLAGDGVTVEEKKQSKPRPLRRNTSRRVSIRTLSPDDAHELFAELVVAEEEYLDGWDFDDAEVLAESLAYPRQ
jgi:hypothetical protein